MKTKIEKELMPLEMVRALMIEKGAKTLKDWEDISIEYNKNSIEYYIPTFSANTKRKYNKTINEILIEKKKNSKPILEIERALDYMRSSGVTNQNLWNLKAKDYNNNISNKYRIPDSSQVHKYYGKTIRELLIVFPIKIGKANSYSLLVFIFIKTSPKSVSSGIYFL